MGQKKKKKAKTTPEVGLKTAKKAVKATAKTVASKQAGGKTPPVTKASDIKGSVAKPRTQQKHTERKDMTTQKQDFDKFTSEATAASKESVDALLKSGTAIAKGTEDLFKVCIGLAQESAEKNAEGVKTLMACKTLNELSETQNKLAQQSFENYISNVTKISELTVKLANTAFEPINTQFTKTMKKATDSAAA